MNDDSAVITLRLPLDLKARLEQLAESTERSRSWLAVDALRTYVDAQEWQIAETLDGVAEADRGEFATDSEVAAVFDRWSER